MTRYLLDPTHPDGASKARFFMRRGFSPDRPEELIAALRSHPTVLSSTVRTVVNADGDVRFVVEGPLTVPDGSEPLVRTVWQDTGPDSASLLTAYPARDRRA